MLVRALVEPANLVRGGIRIVATLCLSFSLLSISCHVNSPDEEDWEKLKPSVTGYERYHSEIIQAHVKQFPDCVHKEMVEDFFRIRCSRYLDGCKEYLETVRYPSALQEIEDRIWWDCHGIHSMEACGLYVNKFASGSHFTEAKTLQEQFEKQQLVESMSRSVRRATSDLPEEIQAMVEGSSLGLQIGQLADEMLATGREGPYGPGSKAPDRGPTQHRGNSPSALGGTLIVGVANSSYGPAALRYAAATKLFETAQALVDAGVSPNVPDVEGHTALEIAEYQKDPRMVKVLTASRRARLRSAKP